MDDREVVAAILAGDPAGLATAYDKYAAPIYGYCRWMLREPAAAEALQDTFVISSAQIHNLRDAGQLRSWLYTAARDECSHPPRVMGSGLDDMGEADDADPDASHAAERAEVRRLIRTVLTWLKPAEREVIELGIRHGLDDAEIAAVLGVSWSRAHALSAHARAQLEKTLGAMLMARTRRKACPALNGLLADWDGQPTIQLADIVGRHVDECETCASRKHGGLRPEVLADLLPLAPLPPVLREQVLLRAGTRTNTDAAAEATADVPAPTPPEDEDPSGNRRAVKLVGWARIKRNPGRATAAVVVLLWVVAALSATIITLTGTHSATALTAQTHARPTATSTPSVSAAATASATPRTSRSPRPSTKPSTGGLAPAFVPTRTASATKKASPKPSSPASASASASASSSASPTPTHKPSPKPSSTPTPTSTASPAPSDTST
jgi:RNA polymerase sigma factor (sigma-70 family)